MTITKPVRERPQYVFCERPKCPACGSVRLLAYATRRHGDESLTRYCKCAACGEKIILVCE